MQRTGWLTGLPWGIGAAVAVAAVACGDTPTAPGAPRPTNSVSGTVTESTGSGPIPVEGAVVTHGATGRSTVTDQSGAYSITDVPGSMATITATKDGFETAFRFVSIIGEVRLDLQLTRSREPPPPPMLSGVVYEKTTAGQVPIAGVRVGDSDSQLVSVTDVNGRYRLDFQGVDLGLRDGFVHLYADKDGFHSDARWVVVDGDTRLDIELIRR